MNTNNTSELSSSSSSDDDQTTRTLSTTSRLHVVFVVDTTGSMQVYLTALKEALRQVTALLQVLFPSSASISLLTYEDYGDGKRLFRKVIQGNYSELSKFCTHLKPGGGGDLAEASKTAFNHLSKLIKAWKNDTVVVFHYTDAPPHHKLTNPSGSNRPKEMRALLNQKPGFDWCKISKRFRKNSDHVKLFTIVPGESPAGRCGSAFYALLGELIALPNDPSPQCITQTTMSILMQLIGQKDESTSKGTQRVVFQRHEQVMEQLMEGEFDENSFPELNTDACKEPTFQTTKKNTADLVWVEDFSFDTVPTIAKTELSELQTCFKHDSLFRELVFTAMEDLIQPQSVMALTTNAIFGRLWRLVCNARDDERLSGLVSRMGGCATSKLLTEKDRNVLKIWIEESYDYADEINEKIKSHDPCTSFYVLDTFAKEFTPSIDGLRSLARAPSPSALANLQKLISHVSLFHTVESGELPVDDNGNCRYIPESMDDYQLFTMLPHLIHAGTRYSLKPAALLAMICSKSSNSLLEERARRFLVSIRGKWLPSIARIDRAEIISYEFSSLITNCTVEGALTDDEREFFRRLHEIWRYRRGRFANFDVVTHISPTKPMLLPDTKEKCRSCRQWTSKTLMDSDKNCGICLWMSESKENQWTRPMKGDAYFVDEMESYVVECTTCQAMYAVLGPMDLNVPPKCHYCRGLDKKRRAREGAPYRRCGCCRAKWCDPSLVTNDESVAFICPVCVHGGATDASSPVPAASQTTQQVSLQNIMDENPMSVVELGFRKKAASIIFSGCKLYQAVVDSRSALFMPPRPDMRAPRMVRNNKPVLNEEALLKNIKETTASATFVDTCQLCFEEMAVEKLRPACGSCTNRCCQDCLRSWYRQNAPGHLFIPCHDQCPFCRQRPRYKVLTQYNHQACGIIGLSRRKGAELRLRPDWYYGWCSQCWKVGFAMERSCAEGVPTLTDFVCEECEEAKQLRVLAEKKNEEEQTKALLAAAKPCPGCHMLTTHLGGCSHMNCPKCKCHWCWQCGEFKSDNGRDVYDHMSAVHRGYGWQGED